MTVVRSLLACRPLSGGLASGCGVSGLGLNEFREAGFLVKPRESARGESSCSSGVERVLGKDEVGGSIPLKSSSPERKVCQFLSPVLPREV